MARWDGRGAGGRVTKTGKRKAGSGIAVRRRSARPDAEPLGDGAWAPPVDVYEADDRYVLNAEVPGVAASALRIEVFGTDVAIRGERRYDSVCSEESYYRVEGVRGPFCRIFSLPEALDHATIQAELADGVLQVTISKAARSRK